MDLLDNVEGLVRQKLEDKTLTHHQTFWSHMVLTNNHFRNNDYLLAMLKSTLEAN